MSVIRARRWVTGFAEVDAPTMDRTTPCWVEVHEVDFRVVHPPEDASDPSMVMVAVPVDTMACADTARTAWRRPMVRPVAVEEVEVFVDFSAMIDPDGPDRGLTAMLAMAVEAMTAP